MGISDEVGELHSVINLVDKLQLNFHFIVKVLLLQC